MENNIRHSRVNAAQVFLKFAREKLKTHARELKAKYKTKNFPLEKKATAELFFKAFGRYRNELNSLKNKLKKDNPQLEAKFDIIYRDFIRKFEIELGPR